MATFERRSVIQLQCTLLHRITDYIHSDRISALIGFLLSLTPLSMDLMGWRGAGGNGAAGTGTYYFFGGLLMVLGSLGEVCEHPFTLSPFHAFVNFILTQSSS
jgi:hypothetical protein